MKTMVSGALLVVLAAGPARAGEDALRPRPGERVRVTKVRDRAGVDVTHTGRLVAWDRDAIQVDSDGQTVRVALRDVDLLQVGGRRKRATGQGAGIGFGLGFVGTTALLASALASCGKECGGGSLGAYAVVAGAGCLVGAAVGAGIGSLFQVEDWRTHRLDRRRAVVSAPFGPARLQVYPQRGGAAASIAWSF